MRSVEHKLKNTRRMERRIKVLEGRNGHFKRIKRGKERDWKGGDLIYRYRSFK